jgi:uncharacterized protein (DUF433 family)
MKKSKPSKKLLDEFPNIIYRRGASGILSPIMRNTGIRVQTIVIAAEGMTISEIGANYDLTESQVQEALSFYKVHRTEIDEHIRAEAILEQSREV